MVAFNPGLSPSANPAYPPGGMPAFDGGGGVAPIIQSIQEVEITVAAGATSNTATITSVDATKSIIFLNWQRPDPASATDDPDHIYFAPEITNATTITVTRGASLIAYVVQATVIEFTSAAVDSVQNGSVTLVDPNLSGTDTITSVDTSRSVAIFRGLTSTESGSGLEKSNLMGAVLTNATTVTVTRGDQGDGDSRTGFYTVIEFAAGIVDSVQSVNIAMTNPTLTATATITSVNTARSVLFYGGMFGGGAGSVNGPHVTTGVLTNATTVTATRGVSAVNSTANHVTTVVEFAAGILASVQRDTTIFTEAAITEDVTVTSVDTTKSSVAWLGYALTDSSRVEPERQFITSKLLNATTIRFQRSAAGVNPDTETMSWEVWEFN